MKKVLQAKKQDKTRSTLWLYIAFIFIVFGTKAVIISNYANSVPFWDAWFGEGERLYYPLIHGTLSWNDLFASHTEHRVFTLRVLDLFLFKLNSGVWDPTLVLYFNAAIHTTSLTFLLYFLQKGMTEDLRFAFFAFATLLFAIPYGHQILLFAFQAGSLQYLFSFIFLLAITRFRTGFNLWLLVIVFSAFLNIFTSGGGILTIAAGIGTLLIRWICGIERTRSTAALIIVLSAIFFTGLYFTSAKPDSTSLFDFLIAIVLATGGGLLYIPVVLFMFRLVQEKRPVTDYSWFVFALSLWACALIFATAYSRGSGILTSRYLDMFSIGFLLNGYCLLYMLQEYGNIRRLKRIVAIWFLLIVGGLLGIMPSTLKALENKKAVSLRHRNNVSGYLVSGNYAFLQKKPNLSASYLHIDSLFYNSGKAGKGLLNRLKLIYEYVAEKTPGQKIPSFDADRLNSLFEYLENKTPGQEIPHWDAGYLKSMLDNQTISSILTPELNSRNTNKGLGLYTEQSKKFFTSIGIGLFFIGISLFLFEAYILKGNRKRS